MNPVYLFYENPHFESQKETKPFLQYLAEEEEKVREVIKGGRALDVGCGNGRSTLILSDISDHVMGIDFSERLLKQAKSRFKDRNNVKLYLENAKSMHFDDSSFNYVVMLWNTFGNLYSLRDRILQEVKRVLKPNGKILISVFSENVLPAYFEMLKQNKLEVAHFDENYVFLTEGLVSERFSKGKLEKIFQKAGLDFKIEPLTEISYWCEARKNN